MVILRHHDGNKQACQFTNVHIHFNIPGTCQLIHSIKFKRKFCAHSFYQRYYFTDYERVGKLEHYVSLKILNTVYSTSAIHKCSFTFLLNLNGKKWRFNALCAQFRHDPIHWRYVHCIYGLRIIPLHLQSTGGKYFSFYNAAKKEKGIRRWICELTPVLHHWMLKPIYVIRPRKAMMWRDGWPANSKRVTNNNMDKRATEDGNSWVTLIAMYLARQLCELTH